MASKGLRAITAVNTRANSSDSSKNTPPSGAGSFKSTLPNDIQLGVVVMDTEDRSGMVQGIDMEREDDWKRGQYAIVAPILAVLAVGAVLVNIYVLLSAFYLKRAASMNLWFSLSLAAVDTFSACMIVINIFLQSYLPIVLGLDPDQCLRIASEMFRLSGLVSSVMHLLALSFTHFLGVLFPLRQHSFWIASKQRKILLLIVLWTCPLAALLVSMSVVPNQAFLSPHCNNLTFANQFPFRTAVSTAVAIPMLTTFAFYAAILCKLKEAERDPVLREARPIRHNKKLLFTMVLLMGTFLMGWFPSLLLYLLYCDDCPLTPSTVSTKMVTVMAISVQLLIILKLFTNPLIYALRIGELRFALCQLNVKLFGVQLLTMDQSSVSQQRAIRNACQTTQGRENYKTSLVVPSNARRKSGGKQETVSRLD